MGGSLRRVLLAVALGLCSLAALIVTMWATDSGRCDSAAALLESGHPEMSLQTYARLERGWACPGASLEKVAEQRGEALTLVALATSLERAGWPDVARNAYLDALVRDAELKDVAQSVTATTTSTTTTLPSPPPAADAACPSAAELEAAGLLRPALDAFAAGLAGEPKPVYHPLSGSGDRRPEDLLPKVTSGDSGRACAADGVSRLAQRLGEAERLYQHGRGHQMAGRDSEARPLLAEALATDPDHVEAERTLDGLLPQNAVTTSLQKMLIWIVGGLVVSWLLLQITARLMRNLLRPSKWVWGFGGVFLLAGTGLALFLFARVGVGHGEPPGLNWRGSAMEIAFAVTAALLGWVLSSRLLLSPPRLDVELGKKEEKKEATGTDAKDAKDKEETKDAKAADAPDEAQPPAPVIPGATPAGMQSRLQSLTSSHSSSLDLVSGPDQNITVPEISAVASVNPILKVLGALAPYRLVPPMRLVGEAPGPGGGELTLRLVDGNRVIGAVTLRDKDFCNPESEPPGRYLLDAAAVWTTFTVKQLAEPKWQLMGTEDWRSFALGYVGSLVQDQSKDPECGLSLYVAALTRDPANQLARYNLAKVFVACEEEDRVIPHLERAIPHLERVRRETEQKRLARSEDLLWARATYSLAALRLHTHLGSKATTATLFAPEAAPSYWSAPWTAVSVDVDAGPLTRSPTSALRVELGSGPNPPSGDGWPGWQWRPMAFLEQRGDRHRYVGHVVARDDDRHVQAVCSLDGGVSWFSGDLDSAPTPRGEAQPGNDGAPRAPDWVKLLGPRRIHHYLGGGPATPAVTAQVHVAGLTDGAGPAPGLQAQLGCGRDVASREEWTWVDMAYLDQAGWGPGHDHRFVGCLQPEDPGEFVYLARFRTAPDQAWVYGDLDGSGDRRPQSQLNQPGRLVVSPPQGDDGTLARAEQEARELVVYLLCRTAGEPLPDRLQAWLANARYRSQHQERMRLLDDLAGTSVLLLAGIWAAQGDGQRRLDPRCDQPRHVAAQLEVGGAYSSQSLVEWAERSRMLSSPRVQYNLACYYTQRGERYWPKALDALVSAMEDRNLVAKAKRDVSLRPLREGTDEFEEIVDEAMSHTHVTPSRS